MIISMVRLINLQEDEIMLNAGYTGYLYHYNQKGNLGGWDNTALRYAQENDIKITNFST